MGHPTGTYRLENGLFVVWHQKTLRRACPEGVSFDDGSYAHIEAESAFAAFRGRGRLAIAVAEGMGTQSDDGETRLNGHRVLWVDKDGPTLREEMLIFPDGTEVQPGADERDIEFTFRGLGLLAIDLSTPPPVVPVTRIGRANVNKAMMAADTIQLPRVLVGTGSG